MNAVFEQPQPQAWQPCRASCPRAEAVKAPNAAAGRDGDSPRPRGLGEGRSRGRQAGREAPCQRQQLCPRCGEPQLRAAAVLPGWAPGSPASAPAQTQSSPPCMFAVIKGTLPQKGFMATLYFWVSNSLLGPKYQLQRRVEELMQPAFGSEGDTDFA